MLFYKNFYRLKIEPSPEVDAIYFIVVHSDGAYI